MFFQIECFGTFLVFDITVTFLCRFISWNISVLERAHPEDPKKV